jgi:hypothetical protein
MDSSFMAIRLEARTDSSDELPDLSQMNAIWEHESNPNIKFTAAKSLRQRFASSVDPPTAFRWFSQVSPYHRCRPKDGDIDPLDALRTPGDQVRTLFRCRSIVHPEAYANRSRPIRFTIAANTGRDTATSANWNKTYFACDTTLAPILTNFSRIVLSVQLRIGLGSTSCRRKLPKL